MRAYMEKLRARGELLEVHRPVHPKHELAAVSDAAHRRWGKPSEQTLWSRIFVPASPTSSASAGRRCRGSIRA